MRVTTVGLVVLAMAGIGGSNTFDIALAALDSDAPDND
jgi:hypothetical protein